MSDASVVSMEGDVAVYRASGIYSCVNALLMYRLGYEGSDPPAWLQERFNAGHEHEPLIRARLLALDYSLSNDQATVEIPVGPTAMIRGHIDFLNTSDRFKISSFDGKPEPSGSSWFTPGVEGYASIVDAKALSQSSFDKWSKSQFSGFPYYLWQQAVYMYALDANGVLMAVKNKNTDKLLYDYFSRSYIESKLPLATILARVLEVEKLATTEGETAIFAQTCQPKMWPCAFYQLHPSDSEETPEADDFDEEALSVLVKEYTQYQLAEKNAKKGRQDTGTKIAELLHNQPASAKVGDSTVVTYYHGSSSPDWIGIAERLGENVEDVQEQYTAKTKSQNLSTKVTLTKKGTKNAATTTE